MWKINWNKKSTTNKDFEFAVCLVCKTEKGYNPLGHFNGGRGNVRSFHAEHFKGHCRQRWNEVSHLFGAKPALDPLPPAEAFALPLPPPPPATQRLPPINQGALDQLSTLLQEEQDKVKAKDIIVLKLSKEIDTLKSKLSEQDKELAGLRQNAANQQLCFETPQSAPTLQVLPTAEGETAAPDALKEKVKHCKCCYCEKDSCNLCYEHESGQHEEHDQIFRSTKCCETCGEKYLFHCGCEGTPDRCWRCNDKWKDCICG
jgi:hypothetical protein